jgi:hypothetical protein
VFINLKKFRTFCRKHNITIHGNVDPPINWGTVQ